MIIRKHSKHPIRFDLFPSDKPHGVACDPALIGIIESIKLDQTIADTTTTTTTASTPSSNSTSTIQENPVRGVAYEIFDGISCDDPFDTTSFSQEGFDFHIDFNSHTKFSML